MEFSQFHSMIPMTFIHQLSIIQIKFSHPSTNITEEKRRNLENKVKSLQHKVQCSLLGITRKGEGIKKMKIRIRISLDALAMFLQLRE